MKSFALYAFSLVFLLSFSILGAQYAEGHDLESDTYIWRTRVKQTGFTAKSFGKGL